MIKRFSVFALLMFLAVNLSAQNEAPKGKVITVSAYAMTGNAVIANQYLSDQEHAGPVSGAGVEFGAMYKRSKNLSWDFDFTYTSASDAGSKPQYSVSNAAGTSAFTMSAFDLDYGTYYNWNPVKNLYFKAGGTFNILGALMMGVPNYINNSIDIDFQTQLKASAGVKYGYNFKKIGLSLQADFSIPFVGIALGGTQYEASVDSILEGEILGGTIQPFCFTSFHNLQSFNTEIELDVIFKKITLFYVKEYNYRSWHLYDVQNYRNYSLSRIGIKLDLASLSRLNSSNRYF